MSKTPKESPTAPRRFAIRSPFSVGAEPTETISADTNDKADATTAMTNLFIMPVGMRTSSSSDSNRTRAPKSPWRSHSGERVELASKALDVGAFFIA